MRAGGYQQNLTPCRAEGLGVGQEARQSPGCGWQGEQRKGAGLSREVAEPRESRGASPRPCPPAGVAVGSASRLAAALAACRDLLVASSVHALLSVSPFPCFFSSLIHPADPLCPHLRFLFSSSSLLSSSSVLSFSILLLPCALHLVFLSYFFSC